jgi:hypothetical protein
MSLETIKYSQHEGGASGPVVSSQIMKAAERLGVVGGNSEFTDTSVIRVAEIVGRLSYCYRKHHMKFGMRGNRGQINDLLRDEFGFCEASTVEPEETVVIGWLGGSGKDSGMNIDLAYLISDGDRGNYVGKPADGGRNDYLLFLHTPIALVENDGSVKIPNIISVTTIQILRPWLVVRTIVDRNK